VKEDSVVYTDDLVSYNILDVPGSSIAV